MAKKVCIIIASESDKDIGDKAIEVLEKFNVPYQYEQASAHRNPKRVEEIVQATDADVFITVAGLAGALPGFVASITHKPVIGVPKDVKLLGLDALFSMVQMPPGIPVATVGIDNGKNAGYLAIRILGIKYPEVLGASSEGGRRDHPPSGSSGRPHTPSLDEEISNSASSSSVSRSYSSAPVQGKAVLESFKFEPPVPSVSEQPLPSLAAFPLFASEPSSIPMPSIPSPSQIPTIQKPAEVKKAARSESVFGDWGIPEPKKKEPPKGDWFKY